MAKAVKHSNGWSLTIFILAIIVAILGLIKSELSVTFLLLAIFLMSAASFIRNH